MRYERYTHKRQYKRYERHTSEIVPPPAPLPVFTSQPQSVSVNEGEQITLTATAENAKSYKWEKDGVPMESQTTNTLTIASATTSDAGSYQLVAANSEGKTTRSNKATVTVTPTGVV